MAVEHWQIGCGLDIQPPIRERLQKRLHSRIWATDRPSSAAVRELNKANGGR